MNKSRRKELEEVGERIDAAIADLESFKEGDTESTLDGIYNDIYNIKSTLEDIHSEEDDYRDNMPENMQQGERYETSESDSDAMGSAENSLDEAKEYLESIEYDADADDVNDAIDSAISSLEEASVYVGEAQG